MIEKAGKTGSSAGHHEKKGFLSRSRSFIAKW
jgi:hypothetical protein